MNRTFGAALAALALAITACGNTPASGSSTGADEAQDLLDNAVSALTEAAAPGANSSGFTTETLACTESSSTDRIMFRTTGKDLHSTDTGQSLERLQEEIERLGMTAQLDRAVPAQEIGFRGNGLRGNVVVKVTGTVSITATTDCHDED